MKKLAKVLVPVLAIIVLATLVFFAAADRAQVGRGPEGELVRLEKVTYGKKHHFVYGTPWRQIISRLPGTWLQRFRAQRLTYETTNDSMVAWLVWKGRSNRVYNYVPSYVIEDDREQRVVRKGNWKSALLPNAIHIEGRELVLPRRGGKFRLYLYHLDENARPVCNAVFNFSKPVDARYNEWQAETLPVRRTNDGVEFTLTGFRSDKQIRPERGFTTPLVELTVAVTENGQLSTNWQIFRLTASDAIGNNNSYLIASYQNQRGEEWWDGTAPLWIDQVWKLRLEFHHRKLGEATRSIEFVVKPQVAGE